MRNYFDVHSGDWDGIYSAPAGSLRWRMNRRFRRAVWNRMQLALQELSQAGGRSVLDVGCGTGELGIRLAAGGARRVLGLDLAAEMVRTAGAHAAARGVAGTCEFAHGNFMTHDFGGETFDFTVALGVLDYVADAGAFLDRMWALTRERLVVSLPHSVPPRSWLRRAWHGLHGSHLYYYTREDTGRLGARLSPVRTDVHTLPGSDRTYVLVCDARPRVT